MFRKVYNSVALSIILFLICMLTVSAQTSKEAGKTGVTAQGAKIKKVATGFTWAEGPAEDSNNIIYFTDNRNNRIYKITTDWEVSVLREDSEGANGLYFNRDGVLIGCAGNLVAIDKKGQYSVIKDSFDGQKFNAPNDLWIDPKGGIYFTDPFWGKTGGKSRIMYVFPDMEKIIVAADDIGKPNGIIGTPDGKRVYVTDWVDKKTFLYQVNEDGTLSDKKVFAPEGDDGMTIDIDGNVYITGGAVHVYAPNGVKISTIETPETAHNVIFYGKDKKSLLITARTSLYSIRMRTRGL